MPYGDGSGPGGMGPRTGRGFGFCSGYAQPGFSFGRGFGRGAGRGYGRGFRPGYGFSRSYDFPVPDQFSPEQERTYLKNQIKSMENTIDELKKRMGEIDKQK